MKISTGKFLTLFIYAATVGFVAYPSVAQTPPFNAYSVSTLGGNCAVQGSIMVQSANGASKCLGAGVAGQILQSGGPGADVSWFTTSGVGTVTSVAATVPAYMTLSGSPITTSGTLGFNFASQTAKTFFAAPNGAAGVPSFRAIAASDIPAINLASGVTGILPIANGGTGASAGSGTVLDNLSGFSGTGIISRTGAGAYSFSTAASLIGSGAANTVFAAPNGASGNGSFRALVGADLPTPTASTLGGVQSGTASAGNYVNGISTAGALTYAALPAIPAPTASTLGGVKSSSAPANNYATGIDTGGNVTYATLPSSPSTYMINGGGLTATSSSTFMGLNTWGGAASTTEFIVSVGGTLSNLRVNGASTGVTAAFTLYINGVASSITCSLHTSCTDLTHSATISPGDVLYFLYGAQPSNVSYVSWSMQVG